MDNLEAEARATQKLHVALPEEKPGGIRKREFLYIGLFAVLLGWYLLDRDVEIDRKVVEEQDLKAEQHAQIYGVLAKCLNEPVTLTVADVPAADCKPRKR